MLHYDYATLLRDKGDAGHAAEQLAHARGLFAELDMSWWQEQADALAATLDAPPPRPDRPRGRRASGPRSRG